MGNKLTRKSRKNSIAVIHPNPKIIETESPKIQENSNSEKKTKQKQSPPLAYKTINWNWHPQGNEPPPEEILCADVIDIIIRNLDLQDISNLLQTNQDWKEICEDS